MRTSLYPVLFGRSRPRFDIASWFSGGSPGVAYDFTDLSTMRQDIAGTVAVTAVGQSVGWVRDLSRASGNHLIAPADIRRGVIGTSANGKFHLACDGTRAYATVASLDLSAVNRVTIVYAVQALNNSDGIISELSNNYNSNTASFATSRTSASEFNLGSRGSGSPRLVTTDVVGSPALAVIVAHADISAPIVQISRNGGTAVSNSSTQGTGNYGSYVLNVGARNAASPTFPFTGHLSRLAVIGGPVSAGTLAEMVAWARDGNNAY